MDIASITTFVTDLNRRYLALHTAKEELFWQTKMGLSTDYDAFNLAEEALTAFKSDTDRLRQCRALLQGCPDDALAVTLKGWIAFFEANVIEDEAARRLSGDIVARESGLARARSSMALGYTHPANGFTRASSVELALKLASHPDEATREACFHGLESIEEHVLASGFLDIVRQRNHFARSLGYQDYYDYKVSTTEGFGKARLFELLDDLEVRTREAMQRYCREVAAEKGKDALRPWNFRYLTQGSAIADMDPYLRFQDAVLTWAKSFKALGISYEQAVLQLDLVVRQGKYENGFCHAPVAPFEDARGRVRARVNFTSNAVPGQVGSGKRAMETLFHEGGHAAHFANQLMGAPCFSQEFAPTSVAFAETQSMFCDSLLGDADWLARYAIDKTGASMPWPVMEKAIRLRQPGEAFYIRSLMNVCYAEKALYELNDSELEPRRVRSLFKDIEQRLVLLERNPRPTLAVPHLLSGEASCIYHGYVLAQAGVAQTRAYFLSRDGHLCDNPAIGPRLREVYWRPGNSRRFADFIQAMTGRPFSMDDLVADAAMSADEAVAKQHRTLERLKDIPPWEGDLDLDCTLSLVHGREVIATAGQADLRRAAIAYGQWIAGLES